MNLVCQRLISIIRTIYSTFFSVPSNKTFTIVKYIRDFVCNQFISAVRSSKFCKFQLKFAKKACFSI